MTTINKGTKKALAIISDLKRPGARSIYEAYGRPSYRKVNAFNAIHERALATEGYNNDLHISGAGSSFFSTVYSFTVNGITTIIKDTPSNTYAVTI